jgi:hypothetical protein
LDSVYTGTEYGEKPLEIFKVGHNEVRTFFELRRLVSDRCQWLTPVILAT